MTHSRLDNNRRINRLVLSLLLLLLLQRQFTKYHRVDNFEKDRLRRTCRYKVSEHEVDSKTHIEKGEYTSTI